MTLVDGSRSQKRRVRLVFIDVRKDKFSAAARTYMYSLGESVIEAKCFYV